MENNLKSVTEEQFWSIFRPENRSGQGKWGDEVYYFTPMEIGKATQGGERHIAHDGRVTYWLVK